MEKGLLIDLVDTASEDFFKMDIIRQLGPYINDAKVLDALCREAVETDSHRVRDALIQILKGNPVEASRRFSQIAICANYPAHRRWALISLSLMECRDAKEAVMNGLRDRHRSVRIAAAFNAGLYDDREVVNALELFFERDRFWLVIDGLRQAGNPLLPLVEKVKKTYGDYHHTREPKGEDIPVPG